LTDQRLAWAAAIASIAGVGVSAYLTAVHYSAPLICATGSLVNCEVVISSRYGELGPTGIPTAAAGLAWFLGSLGLAAAQLRRPGRRRLLLLHRIWAAAGILSVLALVYIEVVLLGLICAWCTVAHVLVLVILLMLLAVRAPAPGPPHPTERRSR